MKNTLITLQCTALILQRGLFLLICLLVNQTFLQAQFEIDVDMPINGLNRPGYDLIFDDEFNSLNLSVWDRSYPGNDHPSDYPAICESINSRHAPKNINNVVLSTPPGAVKLVIKEDATNVCGFSSAEIKTFNAVDVNNQYRDWSIPSESYTEVRMKIPTCKGLGGGMELYGGWAGSIPIESYAGQDDDERSSFQTNMYWDGDNMDWDKVRLRDMNGDKIDIGQHFLTFGVSLTPERVDFYANNVWVSWKSFFYTHGHFYPKKHIVPYNLRIGGGGSTLAHGDVRTCDNLPADNQIDYVRIYIKHGEKAIKIPEGRTNKLKLCAGSSGGGFFVNYIPGATYTWDNSSYFSFYALPQNDALNAYWVTAASGTPIGEYDINLTIVFPAGLTEVMPFHISVVNPAPPFPNSIFLISDNNSSYTFGVTEQANTIGYNWSIDNGAPVFVSNDNSPGTVNVCPSDFYSLNHDYSVRVCVSAVGPCSTSAQRCSMMVIPKIFCLGCAHRPAGPTDVTTEAVPGTPCYYRLSVPKDANSEGYLWSYDGLTWERKQNSEDLYNRYGNYDCGTEPFTIYVKGQNTDYESPVFSKLIEIPSIDADERQPDAGQDIVKNNLADGMDNSIRSIMITNVLGQVIKNITPAEAALLNSSNAYDLPPNAYFVTYLDDHQKVIKTKKLIVVKSN